MPQEDGSKNLRVRFHGGPLDGQVDDLPGEPVSWCEVAHEPGDFTDEMKEPAESVARLRERLDDRELRRIGAPGPDDHVSLYWLEYEQQEPELDPDGAYRYLFLGTDRRTDDRRDTGQVPD